MTINSALAHNMNRVLKWLGYGFGGLVGLVAIAVVAIYFRSEWVRSKTWEVPDAALTISSAAIDQADVDEGRRLAQIFGCFNGCHGQRSDGGVFLDIPNVVKLVAPSLTHLASTAEDADLVRSIRFGIKQDGTTVWGMPSEALYHLTDAQLASIIAFIRSEPVGDPVEERSAFRPLSRLGIAMGDFRPQAESTSAMPERLDPEQPGDPHAAGRQIAMTACAECHGLDLQGDPQFPSPALGIVRAYDQDAFRHFMITGEALGGRDVGVMTQMAIRRFSVLRAEEVDQLHAYLSETGGLDRMSSESPDD